MATIEAKCKFVLPVSCPSSREFNSNRFSMCFSRVVHSLPSAVQTFSSRAHGMDGTTEWVCRGWKVDGK